MSVDAWLDALAEEATTYHERTGCPLVTLSYAQSVDGSLTLRAGQPAPVSSTESLVITHRLRAAHDAVLIGIGTVLADDPQLTVRLANGRDPQPVVLDSHLRFPLQARLLQHPRQPILAATLQAPRIRQKALEAAGACVLRLPADAEGRVALAALLEALGQRGITSLMVEGGAQVITAFLRQRLAQRLMVTLAPVLAGGYHAVHDLGAASWEGLPRLRYKGFQMVGDDLLLWGELE